MRKIKFRAWNILEKNMISSDNLAFEEYAPLCELLQDTENQKFMQYTGLEDDNGAEIYEGDILKFNRNEEDLAKVVFGEFYVVDVETLEPVDRVIGWHYEVIPTDALSKCEPFNIPMPLTDYYRKRCNAEVIGNMYENPELLEASELEREE